MQPYRAMARNNAWANHRLLAACACLGQEEFEARRTSFFPSIRATLNHNLIVDWFYVDAMEGGTLGPAAWTDREPCKTAMELAQAQAAVDGRLIAVVEPLSDTGLTRMVALHRSDRVQRERMDRLLIHLFQHQIHHRGQAHAMLSGTAIRPPQLDEFFPADDGGKRADDLKALGWSEADVWDEAVNRG